MTRSLKRTMRKAGATRIAGAAALATLAVILAAAAGQFLSGAFTSSDDETSIAEAIGPLQIIYSEFGRNSDTIYAASPDDLSRRVAVATVEHAPEYGILPSLSPDGQRIAYTVLSPDSGNADIDAPAEVWVMDIDGRNRVRLATDADLPIAPVWSPHSASIIYRRSTSRENAAGSFELVKASVSGGGSVLVKTTKGVFPVGFSPDGGVVYYVELSTSGTDLWRVLSTGGAPGGIAHLSDDFASDWHLSPDGTRLAYVAPQELGGRTYSSASVLELNASAGGGPLRAMNFSRPEPVADEFNPIWHPNGRDLTVGRILGVSGTGSPAVRMSMTAAGGERGLPPPIKGFDVPLMWSSSGDYLAVRSFEGASAAAPGRSWIDVIDNDGKRQKLSDISDIEVLGWRNAGG